MSFPNSYIMGIEMRNGSAMKRDIKLVKVIEHDSTEVKKVKPSPIMKRFMNLQR